jgi:general secretion pathway protein D
VSYGLNTLTNGVLSAPASALLSQHNQFRGSIANPAIVATLRGTSSNANILANPKIRVRNRDKANVVVGEKVPVFTTTQNFGANLAVAASVSYLDVGLKLEVEPTVQLDNDVSIKVKLEVSNLLGQVTGPGGTTAYQIGQRQASTSLRLNDGETQVLAGLINDEDRGSAAGIPGLSAMPVLGKLFGVQTGTRNKTEVVLLITPHIIRNLAVPDSASTRMASGTDSSPGAFTTVIRQSARVGGDMSGAALAARPGVPSLDAPAPQPAVAPAEATLRYEVTPQVAAGGTVSVSLKNDSPYSIKGDVMYDASKLAPSQVMTGATAGIVQVELPPRGEKVVVLRALPAANGQVMNIEVTNLVSRGLNGESPGVRVDGVGLLTVDMPR